MIQYVERKIKIITLIEKKCCVTQNISDHLDIIPDDHAIQMISLYFDSHCISNYYGGLYYLSLWKYLIHVGKIHLIFPKIIVNKNRFCTGVA